MHSSSEHGSPPAILDLTCSLMLCRDSAGLASSPPVERAGLEGGLRLVPAGLPRHSPLGPMLGEVSNGAPVEIRVRLERASEEISTDLSRSIIGHHAPVTTAAMVQTGGVKAEGGQQEILLPPPLKDQRSSPHTRSR